MSSVYAPFNPLTVYLYAVINWIIFIITIVYLFWKKKGVFKRKDMIPIVFLFVISFSLGILSYQYQYAGNVKTAERTVENSPYMRMSVCMSDISNIYPNNEICKMGNFGGDAHEIFWPVLISFFYRTFGINIIIPILLSILISSFTFVLFYLILRIFFPRTISLLMVISIILIPINIYYFNTQTKEPLFIFGIALLLFDLAYFLSNNGKAYPYLSWGIILAFISETRIQAITLYPLFLILIIILNLRNKIKKIPFHLFIFLLPLLVTFKNKLYFIGLKTYGNITSISTKDRIINIINKVFGYNLSVEAFITNNNTFILNCFLLLLLLFFLMFFIVKAIKKQRNFKNLLLIIFIVFNIVSSLYLASIPTIPHPPAHMFYNPSIFIWLLSYILFGVIFLKEIHKRKIALSILILIIGFQIFFIYNFKSDLILNPEDNFFKTKKTFDEYSNMLKKNNYSDICYLTFATIDFFDFFYIKGFNNRINSFYEYPSFGRIKDLKCKIEACKDIVYLGKKDDVFKFIKDINLRNLNTSDPYLPPTSGESDDTILVIGRDYSSYDINKIKKYIDDYHYCNYYILNESYSDSKEIVLLKLGSNISG